MLDEIGRKCSTKVEHVTCVVITGLRYMFVCVVISTVVEIMIILSMVFCTCNEKVGFRMSVLSYCEPIST